uniref:Serine/threonine-protein kinase PLK n=1 Tax=Nannospalax galili TaxID=1026970 RepID=A0A8C6S1Z0_NANGA
MEPRAQRRRKNRPLVAAFLRDPGSGCVYRRGKLIGKGAFSRCYKLTDMCTSAVFALKVVPKGGAGRLRPRGQVEREIALHSRLRHRNIVAFHGHFADHDHVYLVLEYCSHQSLADVLKARRTLTEPEVRYYLRGLISGLHYLHQRRIVHRDLKPSNFFLNRNMEVKIGDLGLAARVGPAGCCHKVLCGTPNFQAPEVSDIWALGCIMYTVLMGTPPFSGAPLSDMYQNIRAARYPEPTQLSPSARSLIARLLAPEPSERPSLDHLLQDDFFTQVRGVPNSEPCTAEIGGLVGNKPVSPSGPFTPKEASGPAEETVPDHAESASEEKTLLYPETGVHPLTHGTLRNLKGSRAPEVEVAIKKLLLCLDAGSLATQEPPGELQPVLWVPKCVDYSCKCGFGYQLSDGGCGVLFRDGSHMALWPPRGHVSYLPDRGTLQTFVWRDVPSPLHAKLAVLQRFTCYMQRQLQEEGTVPMFAVPDTPTTPGLCLLSFVADPQVLVLMLSNGAIQVSGWTQMHLVLSGGSEGLLLTRWESGAATCYAVDALRHHGCVPAIRQHLRHGLNVPQSL